MVLVSILSVPSAAMTVLMHGSFYVGLIAFTKRVRVGNMSVVSYPKTLHSPPGTSYVGIVGPILVVGSYVDALIFTGPVTPPSLPLLDTATFLPIGRVVTGPVVSPD